LTPSPQCFSEREATTLGDLLGEAISAGKRDAESKGLTFETSFDPDIEIELDPTLTASAVQNLVENAVKHTDEGHVRLRSCGQFSSPSRAATAENPAPD
jgi:signal transduction histidine kinase